LADWGTTASIVILALATFIALLIGRMVWRFIREDAEPEAGGSLGRQLFGRHKEPETPEDLLRR
jgi:hypothetical protein